MPNAIGSLVDRGIDISFCDAVGPRRRLTNAIAQLAENLVPSGSHGCRLDYGTIDSLWH